MNMFRPGKGRGRRAPSSAAALLLAAAMALSLLIPAYAGAAGGESTGGDESTGSTGELPLEDVDLKAYVADSSNDAKFVLTVTDEDDNVITINSATGNYPIVPGKKYKLNQTFSSVKGLKPGRYYVDFPAGVSMPEERTKLYVKIDGKNVEVGSCYFDPKTKGRFIFELNDNMRGLSKVTMSYSLEFTINSKEEAEDFDGHINIELVPDDKTGIQSIFKKGTEIDDNGHVKWLVGMFTTQDSTISGFPVTDVIPENSRTMHHFTQEDMENGIKVLVYENPVGPNPQWVHGWVVTPKDDPDNLKWTESGWTYTMPETFYCWHCNKTLTLDGSNWSYSFEYTSTPLLSGSDSYVLYKNEIEFKGKHGWGYLEAHPDDLEGVYLVKDGEYKENHGEYEENHNISWTITATLPAARGGKAQDGGWIIYDNLEMKGVLRESPYTNDLRNASFSVSVGGGTKTSIPNIESVKREDKDEFCWEYSGGNVFVKNGTTWDTVWRDPGQEKVDDCFYGQGIRIYTRCHCTQDTCAVWNGDTCSVRADKNHDFCLCWNQREPVNLIIEYTTSAADVAQANPDQTIQAHNTVTVSKMVRDNNNNWISIEQKYDDATVTIPKTFTKTMTSRADENSGYVAEYTITVNEGKGDLSASGLASDVVITDQMSETLYYRPNSLEITTLDSQGNTKTLKVDTDYKLEVDSLSHTLKITLLQHALGPYQYTLTYDASLLVESGSPDSTYSNSAEITLLGKKYTSTAGSVVAPQAAICGTNYKMQLHKTDADTGSDLAGASFKLYTNNGKPFAEVTTDKNGNAEVGTDTAEGIIFYEHTVYYLQESEAPNGYQPDNTKHYFMFCDGDADGCTGGTCGKAAEASRNVGPIHVIYTNAENKAVNVIPLTNTKRVGYELPETAGLGTVPFVIGGAGLCVASVAYLRRGTKRKGSSDQG